MTRYVKCVVSSCKRTRENGLSLFRFPKDERRCLQWKAALGILEGHPFSNASATKCHSSLKICALHFDNKDLSQMKSKLKKDAVPSMIHISDELPVPTEIKEEYDDPSIEVNLNIPDEVNETPNEIEPRFLNIKDEMLERPGTSSPLPMSEISGSSMSNYSDSVTQTSQKLSAGTSRKLILKKNINYLEKQLQKCRRAASVENIDPEAIINYFENQGCSETFKNFIKLQISILEKKSEGGKYSQEMKQFALTLYLNGPNCYDYFCTIFKFPSLHNLRNIGRKWPINVGFSDFVFEAIKLKLNNIDLKSKDCFLCIGEMSVKSNLFYNIGKDEIIGFEHLHKVKTRQLADSVLVIMIKSISLGWKQAMAYFFVNSSTDPTATKNIIFESIRRLGNIGVNVRGVISDLGSNFYSIAKSILKVTVIEPYFYVDQRKVFYIFDPSCLLKCTRNQFFNKYLLFANSSTDKKYLINMYDLDKIKQYRLAPKLTDRHIYPTNFQKMNVKYAAEVFSHSVTVAMTTYMSFGQLPQAAVGSIMLLERMDKLFDVFNSSSDNAKKDLNKPFEGSSQQVQILKDMQSFFKDLQTIDKNGKNVTNQSRFIFGWQLTISSFLKLWDALKNDGHSNVYTRNLNQECLDYYFVQIRKSCGNSRNVTPLQFYKAFKTNFIKDYFEHSQNTACIKDLRKVLSSDVTLDEFKYLNHLIETSSQLFLPLRVQIRDYSALEIPEDNCLNYVCGYLVKNCLERHTCEVCILYATSNIDNVNSTNEHTYFRQIDGGREQLYAPHDIFLDYLNTLENKFVQYFYDICAGDNLGKMLKNLLLNVHFTAPCLAFDREYFVSLYVRMRIFYTIKFANISNLSTKSGKENKSNTTLQILQNLGK